MTLKQAVLLYLITLAVFFLIDMVWLGIVAKNFYRKQLGYLMGPKVVWPAVILFYLLFIAGLVVFVIWPALVADQAPLARPLIFGALFGLVAYGTYDLSNLATLKDWPVIVTVVDLVWGTTLGGVVSWLSVIAARRLLRL